MSNFKTTPVHLFVIALLMNAPAHADNPDGIIRIQSGNSVADTMDKMETALKNKGMTIFARINHSAGAEKAGLKLRPTELLIFGNPKAGTPLMLCSQTSALDLPQKALVYEDESGQVWLTYNDPVWMAKRHGITGCEQNLQKISGALATFAKAATE